MTEEIIRDVLEGLTAAGIFVDRASLDMDFPDPRDRAFYEVVMEERNREDACLVTGNIRHFPVEPFVVTPRQMLDIVLGGVSEDPDD